MQWKSYQPMTFHLPGDLELANFLRVTTPAAWLDFLFRYGTHLGDSKLFLALIPLISLALWRFCDRNQARVFFIFAVVSAFTCEGTKFLVLRPRPDVSMIRVEKLPSSPSFPSGHTMVATTVYGGLAILPWICLRNRKMRLTFITILILIPGLVGLSRIYLGVHYLSDVLAGWMGGGLFVFLMFLSVKKDAPPSPEPGQITPLG